MMLIKKNPYIWGETAEKVNMPVLSVDLKDDDNNVFTVNHLEMPISLKIPTLGENGINN